MKKIKFLVTAILCVLIASSCDDKSQNFGDPTVKSELELLQINDTLGNTYPINVLRSIDTVFKNIRIKLDTLKDASGKPILSADNKLQISRDTIFVPRNKTSKYIEIDTILVVYPKNEVQIKLQSNARWQAPAPNFYGKIAWFQPQNVNGGGTATIKVKVLAGLTNNRRTILASQYIYTRDSLTMYKITFNQKAKNEQ